MIFITGDTHGDYNDFCSRMDKARPAPGDTVIVAGDFGFVWWTKSQKESLEKLKELPCTIAFADGNHEDFGMLYSYPEEEWNGGRIHRIAPNIVHLMRGQQFVIEGMSFFVMGGAYSIDKAFRTEGYTWWKEELPTDEEYKTAAATLEKCGYKADYIITHTIPEAVFYRIPMTPEQDEKELSGFLEWVREKTEYRQWFAGHIHIDEKYDDLKVRILYHDVVTLPVTDYAEVC